MQTEFYEQLTDSQRKAVFHTEGPLLVLAGPGSGKTRVITYRIVALINSGVQAQNICAITFTNKATEEMRTRCSGLLGFLNKAHISTFHSLCVRILRCYSSKAKVNQNFSIYDATDQAKCMRQAVKECNLSATDFSPARMLDAVSALKNKLIDVDTLKSEANDFFSTTLAKIYTHYQQILAVANALDFDDLLLKTAFLLRDCTDVRDELSNRYKFVLIDEYQDTNHAQYRIAKLLVSKHNNICATGDPDQSIYRWRGADIRNILAFERDWPKATVVKLEENFRSTPNILKAADSLISFNSSRKDKVLIPTKPQGADIVINCCEDQINEAQTVADLIRELADSGVGLRNIAVFYRINAMSRALEEALIKNKVPYQIVRGIEFYNRKEIRDLLAFLKVLVNPKDEIALLRIINVPPRGIGKTTIDKIKVFALAGKLALYEALKRAETIDSLSKGSKAKVAVFVNMIEELKKELNNPIASVAQSVFDKTGLARMLRDSNNTEAIENINELINAASVYDKQTIEPSLLDYLQQISLFSDVDTYDNDRPCVALMTLHSAKGLEFDNVFIIGLEDGVLPHEKSCEDEQDIEEERRLFFVGITRAKLKLFISYCQYRTIRGQLSRSIPSPFLYELGISRKEGIRDDEDGIYYDDEYKRSSTLLSSFTPGQLVRHGSFGIGRVKDFVDMGENSIVVVRFNSGQTKSLKIKFANLIAIEGDFL